MAVLGREARRNALAAAPLFEGTAAKVLDRLAANSRTRRLSRRDELFHKGDEALALYVVASGRLKVLTTSFEANDVVFTLAAKGDVIGEVGILSKGGRSATLEALEPCELILIDATEFLWAVRTDADLAMHLLTTLASRLERLSGFVEETLFLNLPFRLARQFQRLASDYGVEQEGEIRIDLSLSQTEWGDLVGATREAVNKQLRAWAEQGIVRFEKGVVTILDSEAVESLAQQLE